MFIAGHLTLAASHHCFVAVPDGRDGMEGVLVLASRIVLLLKSVACEKANLPNSMLNSTRAAPRSGTWAASQARRNRKKAWWKWSSGSRCPWRCLRALAAGEPEHAAVIGGHLHLPLPAEEQRLVGGVLDEDRGALDGGCPHPGHDPRRGGTLRPRRDPGDDPAGVLGAQHGGQPRRHLRLRGARVGPLRARPATPGRRASSRTARRAGTRGRSRTPPFPAHRSRG